MSSILFRNLDIVDKFSKSFDESYDQIVKPYAQYVSTVHIALEFITDENAAKILNATTGASELLLYHKNFVTPIVSLNHGSAQQTQPSVRVNLDWMRHTNTAILHLLEKQSLQSLGIYSERIIDDLWNGYLDKTSGPLLLLSQILRSPVTSNAVKKLDIALFNISADVYDLLRQNLPFLTSLTIHHAFQSRMGKIWDEHQHSKWNFSQNLRHLSLKKCTNAYAPHIPHLVRHAPSLEHLLLAMCGDDTNIKLAGPPDNWFSSRNALWKVREPLKTLHLEHVDDWEMAILGEIPTQNLILANNGGSHFMSAFKENLEYFPKLEVISVEPKGMRLGGSDQFKASGYQLLEKICQMRGLFIVQNAVPTSLWPLHRS
jgi:hypothetical protein